MADIKVRCAFTGHRPEALPWRQNERDPRCREVKRRLYDAVAAAYELGYRHFSCGMARGADFYFCEAVIALRKEHPDVILEAVVPFLNQSAGWPARDRLRYNQLLAVCDVETLLQGEYDDGCLLRRNMHMVDRSSLVIAVFNGDPSGGGTLATLSYAMSMGVQTEILWI